MAGAVGEEVLGDIDVQRICETHRPADDFELVHVARADRVGAMRDQLSDDVELPALSGEVQRKRVISLVSNVRVGAALEQEIDHLLVHAVHREVERGAFSGVTGQCGASVDDIGMVVEHTSDARFVATLSAGEQFLNRFVA